MSRYTEKKEIIPVVIRVEKGGDLLAVFPTEQGTTTDRWSMTCYSPREGHSTCTRMYITTKTKPANGVQIEKMLRILRNMDTNVDYRVVHRITQEMLRTNRR